MTQNTHRIQRASKVVAILLSLPSWAFIVTCAIAIVQVRVAGGDHTPSLIFCLACIVCTLLSVLLFLFRLGGSDTTRSDILWIVWSAFPVVLASVVYFTLLLFGLLLARFGLI
jgi:hypothetical protein